VNNENNINQFKKLQSILKTFPNEFEGKNYTITMFTNELLALCPFTGNPDFYKIHLVYIPSKELVELKSLKLYFFEFRKLNITHETLLNIVFDDLAILLKPKYIKIELIANVRGGIKTTVSREQGCILLQGEV